MFGYDFGFLQVSHSIFEGGQYTLLFGVASQVLEVEQIVRVSLLGNSNFR